MGHEILVIVLTALSIIGLVAVGLIMLIIVILLIPFGFEVLATKDTETRVESKLKVAGIKVYAFTLLPARKSRKPAKKAKERAARDRPRQNSRTAGAGRIISRLSLELLPRFWQLLTRLWLSLRLRVTASGRFGAYDPAVTGIVYGAIEVVARPFNINANIQPCFDRECLEGRVDVSGRIWPIVIVADAAAFLFSRPVRQVWFPELKYLVSRR
jgi:hypothetical protein